MFAFGLHVTVAWLRPILVMNDYQAIVDTTHVEELAARLAPLKAAMRAGNSKTTTHECGQIFPHYVARFAVYEMGGLPRCVMTGWRGPRKYFTVALGWRDLTELVTTLRALRKLANGYKQGEHNAQSAPTGIRRRKSGVA